MTLGEKSIAAPENRTCVSGVPVSCYQLNYIIKGKLSHHLLRSVKTGITFYKSEFPEGDADTRRGRFHKFYFCLLKEFFFFNDDEFTEAQIRQVERVRIGNSLSADCVMVGDCGHLGRGSMLKTVR